MRAVTDEDRKGAGELDSGWRWFEFHAAQRMSAFRYFLTIYAAVGGVALALLEKGYFVFGLVAAILTLWIAFLFWSMDKRSRQLIEIGEAIIDAQWGQRGYDAKLNPIRRAGADVARGRRFKAVFRRLFILGCIAALTLIAWAIFALSHQYDLYDAALRFLARLRAVWPSR
jgi:hypothetical protein